MNSGRTYGSPRLVHALQPEGTIVGHYRVHKLMRERDLRLVWKRPFVVTTQREESEAVAANHLDRQFSREAPDRASDIAYVLTRTGWAYLAVVIDLYPRNVVGWALDRRLPQERWRSSARMRSDPI